MPAEPHLPLLLERLRAVHQHLDVAGFRHAFGGAVALGVHAEPRATVDLDINVLSDPADPAPVLAAMPPGVEIPPTAVEELRARGQVRLHWPDPDTPIDLFLPQHPTFHRLVDERAEAADFLGAGVRVISATDLMVFKMLFDRRKDWADIEALLEAGAGDPDEAARWVGEIVGADDHRLVELAQLRAEVAAGRPEPGFPKPPA